MRSIVVQYGPNDHPDLQQYFSSSVYVVHIALSQPGIDYQVNELKLKLKRLKLKFNLLTGRRL
jgi:hypothetical protein